MTMKYLLIADVPGTADAFYFCHISQYEGRSANGEVIYLIRKAIEEFEKEHGKIEKQ